jgi:hypothetical protein
MQKISKTKASLGALALVGTLAAVAVVSTTISYGSDSMFLAHQPANPEITTAFNNFISEHSRSFLTKAEFEARLTKFRDHYEQVKMHNSRPESSYKLGINRFADWSAEEIEKYMPLSQPISSDEDHSNDDEVS